MLDYIRTLSADEYQRINAKHHAEREELRLKLEEERRQSEEVRRQSEAMRNLALRCLLNHDRMDELKTAANPQDYLMRIYREEIDPDSPLNF